MECVVVHSFGSSQPDERQAGVLNQGLEDEMKIEGYRLDRTKNTIAWILMVMSAGLLWLFFHWRPDLRLKFTSKKCPLSKADRVLLMDQYDQKHVERVISPTCKTNNNGISFHKRSPTETDLKLDDKITTSPFQGNEYLNDNFPRELVKPLLQKAMRGARYFTNKKMKYVWNTEIASFEKLRGLVDNLPCSFFHTTDGFSQSEQTTWRELYGSNSLVVHVTPIVKLLLTQALNPFYIFQLFSIILWYADEYAYYATCIVVISLVSLAMAVYEIRSTQRALKGTLTPSEIVSVLRRDTGEFENVTSDLLVPGEVIEVPRHGCVMQCDAVLITGNCIVNESMLTGESVPVTKTPLPTDSTFNISEHSRHVLFCGTQVIQTRYYGDAKVKAVVLRTGFATAKGELVRSILFPKPVDFQFSKDAFKFIGMLALLACAGMIYTIVLMISRGESPSLVVLRTLDLITIVIPPALPAAMTVGIVFAQKRLKKSKVFCISPRSINLCGAVNVFCFDKTGTLTEEGLDFYCIVPTSEDRFMPEEKNVSVFDKKHPVVVAMATCHSLTLIDNQMVGDPLDVKMFQATDWELEEPGEDDEKYDCIMPTVVHPRDPDIISESSGFDNPEVLPYQIGILRMFTFSSKLQRMSVVTRELSTGTTSCFVKGSPEMVSSFCISSTVPSNFQDVLMTYTKQGYRVIGLAYKPLSKLSYVKTQRMERDSVEKDLIFLGLMVFENRLKPQTTPVIRTLRKADIRNVMVTGDNILTALSVARDCEMIETNDQVILVTAVAPSAPNEMPTIDLTLCEEPGMEKLASSDLDMKQRSHFIVNGKSWGVIRRYFPSFIPKLAVRGTVFARFLPEQKQQLIEVLQEIGYFVGMCGDGANDCGALKTAHAGISLSEAEASVASPFTSKDQHIGCVLDVIREGRAALVTSFGVFKFMAGYSMTQFLSVCLLYWVGANFTDFTFLYIDLILLTTLGITFCYTGASRHLGSRPPSINLIGVAPISSVIAQLAINFIFQFSIWKFTEAQPWFEPYVISEEHDYRCHEVTVVFCISTFQYITMSVAFTKGPPHRKTMFTNYLFLVNLVVCIIITTYIVTYPFQWLIDLFELSLPPSLIFRAIIVTVALLNFIIGVLVETYFIEDLLDNKCLRSIKEKRRSDKYLLVERDISDNPISPTRCTTLTELLQLGDPAASPSGRPDDSSVKVLPAGDARSFSIDSTASEDAKSFITSL